MGLDQEIAEKYESMSLKQAINQMDDMGICPLPGCGSLATKDLELNMGKCHHCEFMFCLGCNDRYHPFKRCKRHRIDDYEQLAEIEGIPDIMERNKKAEEVLSNLYIKYCTRECPNCHRYIQMIKDSPCTHIQCPKCFKYLCYACGAEAKGQKHFKERPQCLNVAASILPEELTLEMKEKNIGQNGDYINLKFCARCPNCREINEKKSKVNALVCKGCSQTFCYICNKSISSLDHYKGAKSTCHYESEHWCDL